jgi:hypothetical protein
MVSINNYLIWKSQLCEPSWVCCNVTPLLMFVPHFVVYSSFSSHSLSASEHTGLCQGAWNYKNEGN